jgi:uncharacterized membrane protein
MQITETIAQFTDIISLAGYAIEAVGVFVIVLGTCISTIIFMRTFKQLSEGRAYRTYRRQLGRSIILGLEFLIAGDIIRTVVRRSCRHDGERGRARSDYPDPLFP